MELYLYDMASIKMLSLNLKYCLRNFQNYRLRSILSVKYFIPVSIIKVDCLILEPICKIIGIMERNILFLPLFNIFDSYLSVLNSMKIPNHTTKTLVSFSKPAPINIFLKQDNPYKIQKINYIQITPILAIKLILFYLVYTIYY
jgi:hypothetical protein